MSEAKNFWAHRDDETQKPLHQRIGHRMEMGLGPTGRGHHGQPTENELRFCSWGFLMASVWFADPDVPTPTKEYLEALAELQGLKIPTMSQLPAEFKKAGQGHGGGAE